MVVGVGLRIFGKVLAHVKLGTAFSNKDRVVKIEIIFPGLRRHLLRSVKMIVHQIETMTFFTVDIGIHKMRQLVKDRGVRRFIFIDDSVSEDPDHIIHGIEFTGCTAGVKRLHFQVPKFT